MPAAGRHDLPWVRFEGCCENSGKFLEQRVLEEDGGWILLVIALAAAGAGLICLYLPRLWQRVAAAFGLILGAVAVLATITYTDPDVLVTASYTLSARSHRPVVRRAGRHSRKRLRDPGARESQLDDSLTRVVRPVVLPRTSQSVLRIRSEGSHSLGHVAARWARVRRQGSRLRRTPGCESCGSYITVPIGVSSRTTWDGPHTASIGALVGAAVLGAVAALYVLVCACAHLVRTTS